MALGLGNISGGDVCACCRAASLQDGILRDTPVRQSDIAKFWTRRSASATFHRSTLALEFEDIREEINTRVAIVLKEMSIGRLNGVPALRCERVMLGLSEPVEECKVAGAWVWATMGKMACRLDY